MAAAQAIVEGQTATNPQTNQQIVYSKGHWYPVGANGQAQGLAAPKLAPEDKAALTQLQADATAKRSLADRAGQFMDVEGRTPTGPIYEDVKAPLIGNINPARGVAQLGQQLLGGDDASRLQEMDSISNQTFPMMRPAGQGRLLQVEAEAFKKAFPNVVNYGSANQAIADRLAHEADQANQRVRFAQTFAHSGAGSVADAMSQWDSSLPTDPHLAARFAAARNSYYQTWLQHRGSLQGVDAGWQKFAASRFAPPSAQSPASMVAGAPQAAGPSAGGFSIVH